MLYMESGDGGGDSNTIGDSSSAGDGEQNNLMLRQPPQLEE